MCAHKQKSSESKSSSRGLESVELKSIDLKSAAMRFSYRAGKIGKTALKCVSSRPEQLSVCAWRNSHLGDAVVTLAKIDDVFVRSYDFKCECADNSERGDSSEMTFVLVHGIGVSARYFMPLVQHLRRVGRVIMMDMPGFSNLPDPSHQLSIAGFARCVAQLLKQLGIHDPIILGHSMGAQVVTELAARHPSLSRRILLIGPPVNYIERNIGDVSLRFMQSSSFESSRLTMVALRAYIACGLPWFMRTVPALMNYTIEQRIERLRGKVILVRGSNDYVAPLSWLKTLADHARGAETSIVTIPAAAHSVIYIHPAQIAILALEIADIAVPAWLEDEAMREDTEAIDIYDGVDGVIRSCVAHAAELGVAAIHGVRWLYTAGLEAPTWVRLAYQARRALPVPDKDFPNKEAKNIPEKNTSAAETFDDENLGKVALNKELFDDEVAGKGAIDEEISAKEPSEGVHVVLIPGITETWQAMKPLALALENAGYDVWHLPGTGRLAGSIADYAVKLRAFIDTAGWSEVVVVAHSKGGLVAKAAALTDPRIVRIIALATPWSGSALAGLAPRWWHRYDELRPGAQELLQLARDRSVNDRIVSLAPHHDQEVPNGSFLPGAINRRLRVRGHQRILKSSQVHQVVIDMIG